MIPRINTRRIQTPPAILNDCGHWGQPHQHDERGTKRSFTLCRDCHELILSRVMRLNLDPGEKPRE